MNVEGGLVFDLFCQANRVSDVKVESARPLHMTKVLHGKPLGQGLGLLGLMYRICGVAQRYAGLSAWQEASGITPPRALKTAQELLLSLETVREHLWQVLVSWPALVDQPLQQEKEIGLLSTLMPEFERGLFRSDNGFLPNAQLATQGERCHHLLLRLRQLIERQVLAMPLADWRAMDTSEQLFEWASRHRTSATLMIRYLMQQEWQTVGALDVSQSTLPQLNGEELSRLLASDGRDHFVAKPKWLGACWETSTLGRQLDDPLVKAFAQQYGKGLLTRVVARLVELVELFQEIDKTMPKIDISVSAHDEWVETEASGQGLSMVEAARGRLAHWVLLRRGMISDYAILAPTEWNFHPEGVAVQGLKTLTAKDEVGLRQKAVLWISAIDPCVGFQLRIH